MAGEVVRYKWSSDDDEQVGIVNGECIIDAADGAVYVPVFTRTPENTGGGYCRVIDARNLVPVKSV